MFLIKLRVYFTKIALFLWILEAELKTVIFGGWINIVKCGKKSWIPTLIEMITIRTVYNNTLKGLFDPCFGST